MTRVLYGEGEKVTVFSLGHRDFHHPINEPINQLDEGQEAEAQTKAKKAADLRDKSCGRDPGGLLDRHRRRVGKKERGNGDVAIVSVVSSTSGEIAKHRVGLQLTDGRLEDTEDAWVGYFLRTKIAIGILWVTYLYTTKTNLFCQVRPQLGL